MELFGKEIGKLGFGCMRFPGAGSPEGIDIEEVKRMVDAFMAAGFNYFDTAWAYTGSEEALRKALVERYPRDSYIIATKVAPWIHCTSPEDLARQFDESLATLGLDYVDVLLVHNIGAGRKDAAEAFGAWDFCLAQKELGRARHVGFSTHGTPEEIEDYLAKAPGCEVIQMQINYGDWENPGYRERPCYEYVRDRGIPIIVMEPVRGGMLAEPPRKVREVFDAAEPRRTPVDWALRFPASLEGVAVVLSGMSSLAQTEENIATFEGFEPLSASEMEVFSSASNAFWEAGLVPCTGCNYCAKVCPVGVGISGALTALNILESHDDIEAAKWTFGNLVLLNAHALPTDCTKCGACEDACPQRIPIRDALDKVAERILPRMAEGPAVAMRMD